jgi:ubiquinone/menaquinone biosynthesis C-methylase UbiE
LKAHYLILWYCPEEVLKKMTTSLIFQSLKSASPLPTVLVTLDAIKVVFWMLRGKELDIINVYNALTPVVQLANGGLMLNRGYWINNAKNPLQAQHQFCTLVGEFADFHSAQTLLDVGSGLSIPAIHWKSLYNFLNIACLDINFQGLKIAAKENRGISKIESSDPENGNYISLVNATATTLPFANHSVDRIVAIESSHHFKPLEVFIQECKRVLVKKGLLVFATPVKTIITQGLTNLRKFGIMSVSMPSKNYLLTNLKSIITNGGFHIIDVLNIGSYVYAPLTDYYTENRKVLRKRILKKYPSYVENLLYKSLLKTRDAYSKGIIDYVMIKTSPM